MWLPYLDVFPSPEAAALPGRLFIWPGVVGPPVDDGEPIRRDVVVWLPPGVPTRAEAVAGETVTGDAPPTLPSVWLHDGQNVFDPQTSFAGHWRGAEALAGLAARGLPVIGIAIGNARERRIHEYSPFSDPRLGGGGADAFLDHLAKTIRPGVLAAFPIDPAPSAAVVAGSSLGGLLALWGVYRRPDLAHHCAAFSPSVWFAGDRLANELRGWRAPTRAHIYLDTGAWERGRPESPWQRFLGFHPGSRRFVRSVRRVHRRLRGSVDHLTLVIDRDGVHNEASWARRLPSALDFVVGGAAGPRRPEARGPHGRLLRSIPHSDHPSSEKDLPSEDLPSEGAGISMA
ncbi:MAG: alpha/beta hydrolase-fold protein [Acidobacteriota bacterium]